MRLAVALLMIGMSAGAGAAQAASGPAAVEVRDAVVRVTVVPEDRSDVKVEFLTVNPKLPLEVRREGGTIVVDGGLAHRIRDCHARGDAPRAFVRGVGEVRAEGMPQVVIRTPRSVDLASSGAVFGSIGRSAGLELHDSGCSAWTIADVAGDAQVHESGVGTVRMGAADRLDVHLSGAANVHVVQVRRALQASLSGAGGVQVQGLDGALQANVSGVGRVKVEGGHATTVRAEVSGVGGVEFGGVADSLDASISGFGGVRVKQVNGPVNKSVSGAGHVTIG